MNLSKNLSMCMAILLLVGCGTKSSNQFLAGYLSPGDIRPMGIAHEKGYQFTNITPNLAPDPTPVPKTCAQGANTFNPCVAVHCIWYIGQSLTSFNSNTMPTEGVAVNDRQLPQSTFDLKISRIISSRWGVGTDWYIQMVVDGTLYTANTNELQLTQYTSTEETAPFYDPDGVPNSGDEFQASGVFLKLIYVEFLDDIYLYAIPPNPAVPPPDTTKPFIKITKTVLGHSPANPPGAGEGDFIVAVDYGF